MHKPEQQPEDADELRRLGYERRDVAVRAIAKWILSMFIFIGIVAVFIAWMYSVIVPTGKEGNADHPLIGGRQLPSDPKIQANPVLDMKEFRAKEDAVINSYGWIDQSSGIARIPLDRALEITAERGLPYRGEPGIPAEPRAQEPISPADSGAKVPERTKLQ